MVAAGQAKQVIHQAEAVQMARPPAEKANS